MPRNVPDRCGLLIEASVDRSLTRRRPASGQSDYEFVFDLILDGLERMAYR
jgi:hypothetical protein